MKKNLFSVVAIVAVIFLTSCGGGGSKSSKNEFSDTTVVVQFDKMNGVLSDYFTIEKCVFQADFETQTLVKFEIKRTPTKFDFKVEDVVTDEWKPIKPKLLTLEAELIDNTGVPIKCWLKFYDKEKLEKALYLGTGESMWLEFLDNKNYNELLKGLKHVKITSSMVNVSADDIADNKAFRDDLNKPKESEVAAAPEKEEKAAEKAKNTEKWDKILVKYEEYLDSYIDLTKKAEKGDMEAINAYVRVMNDLNGLSLEMEDAEGEMTTKQIAKFGKLQMKLYEASAAAAEKQNN